MTKLTDAQVRAIYKDYMLKLSKVEEQEADDVSSSIEFSVIYPSDSQNALLTAYIPQSKSICLYWIEDGEIKEMIGGF